jgi:hypothetical protein
MVLRRPAALLQGRPGPAHLVGPRSVEQRRRWPKENVGKRGDAATGGHALDDHATGNCCDATHAHQKPRSHDTSCTSLGQVHGAGGRGVTTAVPLVAVATSGSEETAGRSRLTRSERFASGKRPGWFLPREVSPLHTSANRSSRPAFTCARPAHRLGRARACPRRPARGRHPQLVTRGRSKAPKPRDRLNGRRSAPRQENHHRRGMRGVSGHRLRTPETPDRAAHEPSVSQNTGGEVPLTGPSVCLLARLARLCLHRSLTRGVRDQHARGDRASRRGLAAPRRARAKTSICMTQPPSCDVIDRRYGSWIAIGSLGVLNAKRPVKKGCRPAGGRPHGRRDFARL